jgi:hypothetical protein
MDSGWRTTKGEAGWACLLAHAGGVLQGARLGDPKNKHSTHTLRVPGRVCVECLIGKQKKPILFKVTEPSSIPYRTPPACAKMAAYSDPPPVTVAWPGDLVNKQSTNAPTRIISESG